MSATALPSPPDRPGSDRLGAPVMLEAQAQLDALRTALEVKLEALEAALGGSAAEDEALDHLVLDLSRLATEEAQATARRACLETQLHAEVQMAQARAASDAMVATERAALQQARRALKDADQQRTDLEHAIESLRLEHEALSARFAEERTVADGLRQAVEEAKAVLAAERAAAEDLRRALSNAEQQRLDLRSEIASRRAVQEQLAGLVEQERTSAAVAARALEQTQAALGSERASAAALRQTVAERDRALAALQTERDRQVAALESERAQQVTSLETERTQQVATLQAEHDRQLATLRTERDQQVATLRADHHQQIVRLGMEHDQQVAALRSEHDRTVAGLEVERDRLAGALERLQDESRASTGQLTESRAAAQADRQRDAASIEQLRRELAALRTVSAGETDDLRQQRELVVTERMQLETALQQVESRIKEVMAERDQLVADLGAERRAAAAALAEADSRYADADTRHEAISRAADRRILELELALQAQRAIDQQSEAEQAPQTTMVRTAVFNDLGEVIGMELVESPANPDAEHRVSHPLQPMRQVNRFVFSAPLSVQVDTEAALLVDLSTRGAQLLSLKTLKPNSMIRLVLPFEPPITCRGKVVWARLEANSDRIRYRAGMSFTGQDEAAIEAFLTRHIRNTLTE